MGERMGRVEEVMVKRKINCCTQNRSSTCHMTLSHQFSVQPPPDNRWGQFLDYFCMDFDGLKSIYMFSMLRNPNLILFKF
jgi:hypothetical protein